MLLYDGMPFVECWFGILKAGGVFCMANPLGTTEDFAHLLEYTGCRAIVADARALERLAPLMEAHPRCHTRFAVGADDLPSGWNSWEEALATAEATTANASTLADDVAGWLFTSGTTGKPKGAVHFHRHFAYSTECYAKHVLGLREDDVFVSVSRLFFGYGTGTNLMFPFAVGGTAVLFEDKPTPDRLFDQIEQHGVTVLTNVPAMIRQMVDSDRRADLSRVRVCLSAGEGAPPPSFTNAGTLGGRTRRSSMGSAARRMFHIYITNRVGDVKLGSLGRLVEGYDARIVDAEGHEVADGDVGRLWVKGDSTALCYWRRQDDSRATFRGDWCITADLFRRDADGYYFYEGTGRRHAQGPGSVHQPVGDRGMPGHSPSSA